jgi:2-polyprenyl-3-methyl-5-hydroxy-6-metoxy-1,4-benzoquinol methylase
MRCCNLCGTMVAVDQSPRWRKQGFEIFRCRSCGLLFRGELPTPEELEAIYDVDYFHRKDRSTEADGYADYLGDGAEHRLTARHRVGWLDRLTSVGRLLDVGAAAGFFMDEARKAGWDAKGIDISREMSRHGRERLGLEIRTGLFQLAEYPSKSFDVVTMWDYIEHSIDPASDLSKAADVLRTGGILMLSTGDAASIVARVSGRRWHLLTPRHHNFFFTAETMLRYLDEKGFELLYVGHPGAYYSLRYIVYKLRTMVPGSRSVHALGNWVAARPLGERALRLNLRDIVTIYARRR